MIVSHGRARIINYSDLSRSKDLLLLAPDLGVIYRNISVARIENDQYTAMLSAMAASSLVLADFPEGPLLVSLNSLRLHLQRIGLGSATHYMARVWRLTSVSPALPLS